MRTVVEPIKRTAVWKPKSLLRVYNNSSAVVVVGDAHLRFHAKGGQSWCWKCTMTVPLHIQCSCSCEFTSNVSSSSVPNCMALGSYNSCWCHFPVWWWQDWTLTDLDGKGRLITLSGKVVLVWSPILLHMTVTWTPDAWANTKDPFNWDEVGPGVDICKDSLVSLA